MLQKIGKQNKQLSRNTILRQNIFFLTCTPIAFLFGTHLWLFAFWFRLFLVGYRRRVKVIMDHSTTALLLIFVRGEGVSTVHSPSSTVHRPPSTVHSSCLPLPWIDLAQNQCSILSMVSSPVSCCCGYYFWHASRTFLK